MWFQWIKDFILFTIEGTTKYALSIPPYDTKNIRPTARFHRTILWQHRPKWSYWMKTPRHRAESRRRWLAQTIDSFSIENNIQTNPVGWSILEILAASKTGDGQPWSSFYNEAWRILQLSIWWMAVTNFIIVDIVSILTFERTSSMSNLFTCLACHTKSTSCILLIVQLV